MCKCETATTSAPSYQGVCFAYDIDCSSWHFTHLEYSFSRGFWSLCIFTMPVAPRNLRQPERSCGMNKPIQTERIGPDCFAWHRSLTVGAILIASFSSYCCFFLAGFAANSIFKLPGESDSPSWGHKTQLGLLSSFEGANFVWQMLP